MDEILIDVALGRRPKGTDTPEEVAFRGQTVKDCAWIVAKGGTIDISQD
jgi:hypothetical protein